MKLQFSPLAASVLSARFETLAAAERAQVEAIEQRHNDALAVAEGIASQLHAARMEANDAEAVAAIDFASESERSEAEYAETLDAIDAALAGEMNVAYSAGNSTRHDELHAELIKFRKARQGIVDEEQPIAGVTGGTDDGFGDAE